MATVSINPKYEEEVSAIARQLRMGGVVLSGYAKGLLSLIVEGWFEEPPTLKTRMFDTEEARFNVAREIVAVALKDPHISRQLESARGHVNLFDLLPALSDSGKKVLRDFLDKGF